VEYVANESNHAKTVVYTTENQAIFQLPDSLANAVTAATHGKYTSM